MALDQFKPEIFSKMIEQELEKKMVFADFCNRDYEGEVKAAGDSVRILELARPTITTTTDGAPITISAFEELQSASQTMQVLQQSWFAPVLHDVDERQSVSGILEKIMTGGAIEQVSTELANEGVKEQEVTETAQVDESVSTAEQEVVKPERDKDRDSWFAEKRRELEAKEKEMAKEYEAKLEAERQRIAELESKTKTYEKKEKYEGLRKHAEEYGLDYDELVAEVERQEAEEAEKAKTIEELQAEKSEKERLAEEKAKLEYDIKTLKMSMEDREELLALDPTIKLNELSEDFYKFRLDGYSPTKAYKLAQTLKVLS